MQIEFEWSECARPASRSLGSLCSFQFVLAGVAATAATDWENEAVLQINREPARATFVPFATAEQAFREHNSNSPCFLSLNGDWRFHWVPRPELRNELL
jgi:beta-galactosidase